MSTESPGAEYYDICEEECFKLGLSLDECEEKLYKECTSGPGALPPETCKELVSLWMDLCRYKAKQRTRSIIFLIALGIGALILGLLGIYKRR